MNELSNLRHHPEDELRGIFSVLVDSWMDDPNLERLRGLITDSEQGDLYASSFIFTDVVDQNVSAVIWVGVSDTPENIKVHALGAIRDKHPELRNWNLVGNTYVKIDVSSLVHALFPYIRDAALQAQR